MQIGFSRYFKRKEITFLNNVFQKLLIDFRIDLEWLDSQISTAVMLEFYKKNLAVFMFPEDENFVEFSDAEALAFLDVFRAYDELYLQSICQEVIANVQTKSLGT